jgi:hypothetical protein
MQLPGDAPSAADDQAVRRLLGREPQGEYTVVVRSADGEPVVLCNAPLLRDGTPMPTLFWLCGHDEVIAVSRLEADGAVNEVEAELGMDTMAEIHSRYESLRDSFLPAGHTGPRPSGGVGGTRRGVKCLHAHFGFWLAGGDDAAGEWVADRLAAAGVTHAARVA